MALAVDSEMASNLGDGAASPTSPRTFSFTNTAGTVLYIGVGLGVGGAETAAFTGVTYNGVALTNIVQISTSGGATGGQIAWWRLLSPATGSNTVSIGFTQTGAFKEIFAGCISFTGNNVTTPEAQTPVSNRGSSGTASIALTGVTAGNISIGCAGAGSSMSAQTQTLTWAKNVDDFSSMGNGRASRSTSSGSVTHSFTISSSDTWASVGVEVAAAGGGGGGGGRILSESGILSSGILTGGALIGGSGKTLFFPSLAKRWVRRRLALA